MFKMSNKRSVIRLCELLFKHKDVKVPRPRRISLDEATNFVDLTVAWHQECYGVK